ncbi:MAG: hypothetical protein KC636_39595, partial [Myxococcales bacterium]|nr:hypothetical protein [Myxococcales bacterium]
REAAAALLAAARPPTGAAPYVRFSGLQIDGALGGDGYHFWDWVDPSRDVAGDDNMATFEYFALVDEVAAAPLVTLNFGSGTASEAAAYVTHLAGEDPADPGVAARHHWGRVAPYDVAVFEIGNEVHSLWNTGYSDHGPYSYANPAAQHGGDPAWYGRPTADPADYAARALEYIATVRAVHPQARFWVPISMASMDGWGGIAEAVPALEPLLVDPAVEAVVVHHYQVDDGELLGLAELNDPRFIVAGSEVFAAGFDELRELLDDLDRDPPLGIVITEYHVAGFFAGARFTRGEQAVVGLGIADMMISYARHGIAHAAQHMALNFEDSGDLLFESWYNPFRIDGAGAVVPAASYQATALIAAHLHARTVLPEVTQATEGAVAVFGEERAVPRVSAVAFVDDAGAAGSLVALHRDFEEEAPLTFDLPAGWAVAEVSAYAPPRLEHDVVVDGPVALQALSWEQVGGRVALTLPPHSLTAVALTCCE